MLWKREICGQRLVILKNIKLDIKKNDTETLAGEAYITLDIPSRQRLKSLQDIFKDKKYIFVIFYKYICEE